MIGTAGVADAAVFAPAVEELAALALRPGWVAEEPEVHQTPHLRGAGVSGLRVLECTVGEDGILEVAAEHDPGAGQHDIRRRAWALIGAVAESPASVHERRDGDAVVFEVVTGVPERSGHFATHGHAAVADPPRRRPIDRRGEKRIHLAVAEQLARPPSAARVQQEQ